MKPGCRFRWLGRCEYTGVADRMLQFTDARDRETGDEIWFLEHFPVFTLGTSSRLEPHRNPANIPLVRSKRGGQITYHGPGQLVAYLMLDLRRLGIGPRRLVELIEQCLLQLLADYGLQAERRPGAPGVYVGESKIAALGLRIRNGCSFHGFSLNVDMDTMPFTWIDPCGYPGLAVTTLAHCGVDRGMESVRRDLAGCLADAFGWDRDDAGPAAGTSVENPQPAVARVRSPRRS